MGIYGEEKTYKSIITNDYNIEIYQGGTYHYPRNYKVQCHEHWWIEINYVISGFYLMKINDEFVYIGEGECIILFPQCPHSHHVSERNSCKINQLEINVNKLYKIDNEEVLSRFIFLKLIKDEFHGYIKFNNCKEIESCISRINYENINRASFSEEIINILMWELIMYLSRHIEKFQYNNKRIKNKSIIKIINEINCNIGNNINIENICEKYNISSRYLRKKFKEHMNITVIDYVTNLRINKAKDLLKNSTLPITEIAMECGFSSSQYFNNIFKKKIGITPMNYRRSFINNSEYYNENSYKFQIK